MKSSKATAKAARKKVAKSPAQPRQALLVLGMHRSGTSALTGMLAKLGATAPRSPMPGNEFNERGYWESHKLAVLHDKILQSAGSRWSDWGRFNPDWFDSIEAGEFERHLEDMIAEEYDDKPLLLIKDPRISRFLPLWLRVLDKLHVVPKVVVPVRHPEEVSQSLARRDHFGRGESRLLWLRHVLDAESATRGLQRTFVSYDDLLADWKAQARRIGEELAIRWPRWSADTEVEVEQFLSAQLRHHQGTEARIAEGRGSELDQWASEAHRIVQGFAHGQPQDAAAYAVLDGIHGDLDRTSGIYGPVVREHEVTARLEHDREKAQMESRIKDERSRADGHEAALMSMEQRATRAESDAKSRAGRLLLLQNENDKLQSRVLEQAERYTQREAELQAKLVAVQGEIEAATRQVAGLKDDLASAESRLGQAADRGNALEAAAEQYQRERTSLEESTLVLREELASVNGQWAVDREQLAVANDDLQAKAQEAAHARAQADEREHRLRALESDNQRLVRSLDERFRELAVFARTMEKARAAAGATSSRLRQEQERAGVLDSRLQSMDHDLTEARRERDALASQLAQSQAELGRMQIMRDQLSAVAAAADRRVEEQGAVLDALTTQLAVTSSALRGAREDLARVLDSNTWKLGRPLRVLRRVLSGGKVRAVAAGASDVERIRAAGVFDEAWYRDRYPDVASSGVDPVQHYLLYGCDEGRDPSPGFSTAGYYSSHPEIAGKRNALLHYLDQGA